MREFLPTVEIVSHDMGIDPERLIQPPGRRVYDERALAARAVCTLTLHGFGHSWPSIAGEFLRPTHTTLMEQANAARAGRFAGLYPDGLSVDEYAASVAARVPGRLGGAA